ncbi:MAG: type IV pilus secretin PilQ [Rhodocyclaceae bacterium]|nr:type IV pilus secretin PilQ [Rhodocyclaceae bacterium]
MRNIAATVKRLLLCAAFVGVGGGAWGQAPASADAPPANSIDSLQVTQQGGNTVVKLTLREPLATVPASFSIANPARVAFDFPATGNGLGRSSQAVGDGDLKSVNIVQVSDRTRMVMNLRRNLPFETRIDGKALFITFLNQGGSEAQASPAPTHFAEVKPESAAQSIRDINFRRGKDGEGLIMVDLSDPNVGIDIRRQGTNLVVEFAKTALPENLRRRLDVTDFATPVTTVTTMTQGDRVRMVITPHGLWEDNAYQSDNQFVIEVRPVVEDPNKLVQGSRGGYQGEKLSLNFQNVEVRSVLQVISDFTNLNIVVSDSVTGSLTLRLKDVPWDQALDIILNTRGLDMRKNGNVIWIAPRDELAAKEKLSLESRQQISDLEPTRTETFQLNYHKAKAVQELLKNKDQSLLSKRGGVAIDERSNKLFVTDTPSRLDDVRRLLAEIDVASRQVLIEARIVEASENFAKNLGARLGFHDLSPTVSGSNRLQSRIGGSLADTGAHTGQSSTTPNFLTDSTFVNLPASTTGLGGAPGALSLILFNPSGTRFLNLELSALESDGNGKTVTSPRILTADKVEALIEQGVQVPYLSASSSGATTVTFQKAVMALKVTPNITPDGRIMMTLDINKDAPDFANAIAGSVPINTKHVKTDVLVDNGGTVVIGGIFEQIESKQINKVPFFGDIPVLGLLFRNKTTSDQRTELLVFITPKIVADNLTVH